MIAHMDWIGLEWIKKIGPMSNSGLLYAGLSLTMLLVCQTTAYQIWCSSAS